MKTNQNSPKTSLPCRLFSIKRKWWLSEHCSIAFQTRTKMTLRRPWMLQTSLKNSVMTSSATPTWLSRRTLADLSRLSVKQIMSKTRLMLLNCFQLCFHSSQRTVKSSQILKEISSSKPSLITLKTLCTIVCLCYAQKTKLCLLTRTRQPLQSKKLVSVVFVPWNC